MYLLDSCVISDFVKDDVNTVARLKSVNPSSINVSTLTVMEHNYGLFLNPQVAVRVAPIINKFFDKVRLLPYNTIEAIESARIRAYLKAKGTQVGAYDVLIAATAITNQLILVTSNYREFERIEGLELENWRL